MPTGIYERNPETIQKLRERLSNPVFREKQRQAAVNWWRVPENREKGSSHPAPNRAELIGRKFGYWTVLSFEGVWEQRAHWKIRCICGTERIEDSTNISNPRSISCGCSKRTKQSNGASARASILWGYKSAAKKRHLEWNLSDDEFDFITGERCHYCGVPPSAVKKSRWGTGSFVWNGIDRVNNKLGYIFSNVVSCCSICNHAKHTLGYEEFLNWIQKVYEYQQIPV